MPKRDRGDADSESYDSEPYDSKLHETACEALRGTLEDTNFQIAAQKGDGVYDVLINGTYIGTMFAFEPKGSQINSVRRIPFFIYSIRFYGDNELTVVNKISEMDSKQNSIEELVKLINAKLRL